MDQRENLLLLKGVDKTGRVQSCEYDARTGKYRVSFGGDKIYTYGQASVEWMKHPRELDPADYSVSKDGKALRSIDRILEFSGSDTFWRILYSGGRQGTYRKQDLEIQESCLRARDAGNKFQYLRELAEIGELKDDDGVSLLGKNYQKLKFIGSRTALAAYLSPGNYALEKRPETPLIFPFGGNASQFRAVEQAMRDQISVIQGPPGTGKTQTILNIIANLLIRGQSVQVVSNNNSAVENVLEKLAKPQNALDFLVAELGCRENKRHFLEQQSGRYPDLAGWRLDPSSKGSLQAEITERTRALSETFGKQERLACARAERKALSLEADYFTAYCEEKKLIRPRKKPGKRLKSQTVLDMIQSCEMFSEQEKKVSIWFKLRSVFLEGAFEWAYLSQDSSTLITYLQWLYYFVKGRELDQEIRSLEAELDQFDAEGKMRMLTQLSMTCLRGALYERFGGKETRPIFGAEVFRWHPKDFLKEYPVVLSTTFSAANSLKNATFDYVIMDEASQVDVVTGALALSCARNAVIVGDLKQLPNVVTREMQEKTRAIWRAYRIPEGYAFAGNSFLKSICTVIPDVPQTLLREHYRCHPQIIEFCNQKFYQGRLIIMTEDHGERDTLSVYRTNSGNHHRGRVNQRQIDVTTQEVLPGLQSTPSEEIGIIAPYRAQVNAVAAALPDKKIEVDTVHKFQGREKNVIVLMTVDDQVTDFSDDPYLLNVAISRAKDRLCLVTSGDAQPADSNIQDLIAYIQYHNFQVVDSRVYSIFDLLYQQYTQQRVEFLRKHRRISEYDSENIMYGYLTDMLRELPELTLNVICHQPLRLLIRNPDRLTDEERRYAFQPNTHVDFMIYNQISKAPVLAIEVDGVQFHREGTRQAQRDKMKNTILSKYGIRLLRLPTNGSGELEKVRNILTGGGKDDHIE